jgi:hypothetical protein
MLVVAMAALGFVALSATSAPASITPPSPPGSVRGVPGNASATVSWVKPTHNGGAIIDAYKVITYLLSAPRPTNVFHSSATTQTILELTNGKSYTFKVAAHNAAGWGELSAMSPAVTIGVPGPPLDVAGVAGNALVKLTWKPPTSNSGLAIDQYRVTPLHGTSTLPVRTFNSIATTQMITGLVNGQVYSFLVSAHNARGWGQASAESADVTVGVPAAPSGVAGVPGGASATISWTAPSTANGVPIDAYRITSYLDSDAQSQSVFHSTATTQVFVGLTRGKQYRFRVDAHNTRGWGPKSNPSALVTPGAPLAPTDVVAVAGARQATVSWTAPVSDNGAAVGAYEVIPYRAGIAQPAIVFSSPATSHVITGLTSGEVYRFRVVAHNSRGWGPMSLASNPVTPS